MCKKAKVINILCVLMCLLLCGTGCGSEDHSNVVEQESSIADVENSNVSSEEDPILETTVPSPKENSDTEDMPKSNQVVETDLKPSDGLEFESNGDGTCTIVGIGTCTDKELVIPVKSPDGDTVTLIDEYAFYSLEDVESVLW